VWHVSLSYWHRRRPIALDDLTRDQRLTLHREALRQLEDVGDRKLERWDAGDRLVHVVHFRRALTSSEELLLPPGFLACPAVDIAGETKPINLAA
jgi:hypothetical protein